jgi:aminoglycoside phosphotransferase (APT) family kinase protein
MEAPPPEQSRSIALPGTGRLADWLRNAVALAAPVEIHQVSGGLSNITCIATDGVGRQVVVRRPPIGGHGSGGAHDVLREARIVSSLERTDVPVPRVVATCNDLAVFGSPFYVMEHAPGHVLRTASDASRIAPEHRRDLGFALIDLLVVVQAVDLDAVGVSDLRRATPYLERQLRRWSAQWRAVAQRSVPAIDYVHDRLRAGLTSAVPQADRLVHGDFRFGNVMVVRDPVPRISALLDWELATTGHPLADLGFLGARMQAPPEVIEGGRDPSVIAGFPTFDELTAFFAKRTGVGMEDLPLFVALSAWRWAIIAEGIQNRIARGDMGDFEGDLAWYGRRVDLLADFAAGAVS